MKWVSYFVIGVSIALSSFYLYWVSHAGYGHVATQWITNFYQQKKNIVNKVTVPKLLIASGSTAMFAFDSERLSKHLDMPVVNYGVAVGLGLKFILHKAKEQLSSGDVILLPLEYKLYADEQVPDKTLALHLLDNSNYFEGLSFTERMSIVLYTPTTSFVEALTPAQGEFHKDLYNASRLNDYGDMSGVELDRIYLEHNVHKYSFPNVTPSQINARSHTLLTEFVDWAKAHNVKVVAMPPAIKHSIALTGAQSKTTKESLYHFWKSVDVPFIGKFEDFEFDKSQMFENPYHLNTSGRTVYMDTLLAQTQLVNVVLKHQDKFVIEVGYWHVFNGVRVCGFSQTWNST